MIQSVEGLTFAGNVVSDGLYKFRGLANTEEMNRLKGLLNGEIYFSTCEQLNDPFEMRVKLEMNKNPKERLSGVNKSLKESPTFQHIAPAKRLEIARRFSNRLTLDPQSLKNAANSHYERMRKNCYIFCASATRSHPLLWSHYADKHMGICVHLNHKALPFAAAARVDYDKDFPIVTYPLHDDLSRLMRKSVLTKANYWDYEQEYRLFSIREEENDAWHLGLNWKDEHTALVNPISIVGITIGATMPDPKQREIVDYCRKHHPNLTIDRAEIRSRNFGIKFEPLV